MITLKARWLSFAVAPLVAVALATGVASASAPNPDTLEDRYVVAFVKGASQEDVRGARAQAVRDGAQIHYNYRSALRGFAATLPEKALNGLRHNKRVDLIEADQVFELDTTQSPVTWGLDRIDQRTLPLTNSYTYNQTGAGVTAYVIDTGIRISHTQFGGRATSGTDTIDGGSADDCNGHGTHVAGSIGGSTYGVAKSVQLVAVRVLNCQGSGTTSGVIAGIDWVTSNHQAGHPAVANMSLGGGASTALDNAVNNSITDGVTYAVAAGNGNALGQAANACNYSPARVPAAITVSATDSTDGKPSWANIGTCVDLFAPGGSITSSWHTSDTATNTISGTSMATPHVAGAAVLYLHGSPSASPAAVHNQLVATATQGVISNPGSGSPNRLLFTGDTTAPPPPTGCTGYQQTFSGALSGTGDADIHPNGSYYYAAAGTHRGCLRGPASGADFDLALYRWNGYSWTRVAVSQSTSSSEDIAYTGTAGYYYWRVYSYSGNGTYTFAMTRP